MVCAALKKDFITEQQRQERATGRRGHILEKGPSHEFSWAHVSPRPAAGASIGWVPCANRYCSTRPTQAHGLHPPVTDTMVRAATTRSGLAYRRPRSNGRSRADRTEPTHSPPPPPRRPDGDPRGSVRHGPPRRTTDRRHRARAPGESDTDSDGRLFT